MSTKSNQTLTNFLENNGSGITEKLGSSLVVLFGGLEGLLSDYESVKDLSIDNGMGTVVQLEQLVEFYKVNKPELLSLIGEMLDFTAHHSVVEFISSIALEDSLYELDNDSCTMDDVAKALYVEASDDKQVNDCYQAVAAVVTWLAAEQFALAWHAEYQNHCAI